MNLIYILTLLSFERKHSSSSNPKADIPPPPDAKPFPWDYSISRTENGDSFIYSTRR